jgi:uncharacterized RDD family membrane protein YckC
VLSRCENEPMTEVGEFRADDGVELREGAELETDAREAPESSLWRGELLKRFAAYRARRRRVPRQVAQTSLPFADPRRLSATSGANEEFSPTCVAVEEPPTEAREDFSFTIAIGRMATEQRTVDGRVIIDVSPHDDGEDAPAQGPLVEKRSNPGLYSVAPMTDRVLAAVIDAACLLFACGGFLALFGSLGGHLTLSKLNAAVSVAALAVVYLQYFALFTVFGGTTPGMMFRGLQVVSFSGDTPTARQMLLRSVGYVISAGTCFLGFFWAIWDEDKLTWHDRFSKTYLSSAQTYAEIETHGAAHPH